MQLIRKILFPTDFSDHMDAALATAKDMAKTFECELKILHVLPEEFKSEKLEQLVREKMEQHMTLLKAENIACSYVVRSGNITDLIVATAERERASLILLGASQGRKMDTKLGSNSEKVIRNSSIPVWVVEPNKAVSLNKILCPIDYSEESKIALDNAAHLCRRFDAELSILNVVRTALEYCKNLGIELEDNEEYNATESDFDTFLSGVNLQGVNWSKEIRIGEPAEEIVAAIKDLNTDLLLIGSTGKEGVKRFLLGSVTEKVIRSVPCSFIVSKSESLIKLKLDEDLEGLDAIYSEGVQLDKDGFTEEAIVMWNRCTTLNQYYLKAWGAMALAYDKLGDKEKSAQYQEIKARIQREIWDDQIEADLRSKNHMYK